MTPLYIIWALVLTIHQYFVTCMQFESDELFSICQSLIQSCPNQVFFPGGPRYTTETQEYWSLEAWLHPRCVFSPITSTELAKGIRLLVSSNTTFAIRGGGHAPVTGLANTNHGVLISTNYLNELEIVSSSQSNITYVRCGAGVRWGQLFDFLSTRGLVSLGGRYYTVGMGTAIGGGISYLSQQHGWVANSIINFEVVTADGELVQANAAIHSDLFWALKGGGNNFGVVTRLDLKTFPDKEIYVTSLGISNDSSNQFFDALTTWMLPGGGNEDPKGALNPSTQYTPSTRSMNSAIVAYYDDAKESPRAFQNFTKIPSQSTGTTGLSKLSLVVSETKDSYVSGVYNWKWYSTSIKFSNKTVQIAIDTMVKVADELVPNIDGFVGIAEEPISAHFVTAARKNGGDPMDLDPSDGGFLICLYYAAYGNGTTSDQVENYLQTLIQKVEERTKPIGLYYPFKFLNNLGASQDEVFTLYGKGRSIDRLREVSRKYDPQGVFQRLVPGFKLSNTFLGHM